MSDKPIEIVKRILSPDEQQEEVFEEKIENSPEEIVERITFGNSYIQENELENSKTNIPLTIFGLLVLTVLGYFGFKLLTGNDKKVTSEQVVEQEIPKIKETVDIVNISPPKEPTIIEKVEVVKADTIEPKVSHEAPPTQKETRYIETLALPTQKKELEKEKIVSKHESKSSMLQTIAKKEVPTQEAEIIEKLQAKVKHPIIHTKENSQTQDLIRNATQAKTIQVTHKKEENLEKLQKAQMEEIELIKVMKEVKYAPLEIIEEIVPEVVPPKIVPKKVIPKKVVHKKVVHKKRIPKKLQKVHYERIPPRVVVISKGDSLASLAKMYYNDPKDFKRIIRANRRIKNSKSPLRLGQEVIIPRKDGKTRRRFILVEKGNNLALLAKRFYGDRTKIQKIINANYRIKSAKSTLRIGQKIYIPQ